METAEMYSPPSQTAGTSSQSLSSAFRRQDKYQFVDLTDTPTPTPSPERESQLSQSSQSSSQPSQSTQYSSQGSSSSYAPSKQAFRAPHSTFDLVPLGKGLKPAPIFARTAAPQRSAFAPFPSYSTPSSSKMPAPGMKDRHLAQGDVNTVIDLTKPSAGEGFGSSIVKSKPSNRSDSSHGSQKAYGEWIKPGTGAFNGQAHSPSQKFKSNLPDQPSNQPPTVVDGNKMHSGAWPSWLVGQNPNGHPQSSSGHSTQPQRTAAQLEDEPQGEVFDLNTVKYTQADYERYHGDAEEHMRELLSGAVGDGEDEGGVQDGDDQVEGFANGVRLMPHQVRGVKWMQARESGRKYGGILADVS